MRKGSLNKALALMKTNRVISGYLRETIASELKTIIKKGKNPLNRKRLNKGELEEAKKVLAYCTFGQNN
jgi:hypothetical protein